MRAQQRDWRSRTGPPRARSACRNSPAREYQHGVAGCERIPAGHRALHLDFIAEAVVGEARCPGSRSPSAGPGCRRTTLHCPGARFRCVAVTRARCVQQLARHQLRPRPPARAHAPRSRGQPERFSPKSKISGSRLELSSLTPLSAFWPPSNGGRCFALPAFLRGPLLQRPAPIPYLLRRISRTLRRGGIR